MLDLFTSQRPEWGVTETALKLEIPRSSAHDLLATLAETGLLRRVEGNRYRLGWKLLALSNTVLDTSDVRTHARPVMRCVATKLGATVHLAILDEGQVMYIDKLVPAAALPVALSAVGKRLPPHCSAVGKVLLAHEPRRSVIAALERCGMCQYTERTICSPDRLGFELAGVRQAGIARDRGGAVDGVCCHAAPIFDAGRVVSAISISVSSDAEQRFADRYDEVVGAAGVKISRSLGKLEREVTAHAVGG